MTAATPVAAAGRLTLRRPGRGALIVLVLLAWLISFPFLRGRATLTLAQSALTPLHRQIGDLNDAVGAGRNSNPIFLYGFNVIRLVIDQLVHVVQALIAQPALGLPIPVVGWLGVVVFAGYLSWLLGGVRIGLLAAGGLVVIGLLGLWQEAMDTLALTLSAVAVALLVGIPLGVWAGVNDRVHRLITPLLDFMQTMPTFVYLAPLTLFFLIGPASATIATLIYALPPVVRLTDHGIRAVQPGVLEAAGSLGATRRQTLTQVMLPMARRTIVLGANQTIMAALAMVTIAALIDAPGLGKTVVAALATLDVGAAFTAGLAIVILAIVLDRVTTAASERGDRVRLRRPGTAGARSRRPLVAAGALVVLLAGYASRTYLWAAEFPDTVVVGGRSIALGLGRRLSVLVGDVATWVQDSLAGVTGAVKNVGTGLLLDPLQVLLTDSPWWLVALVAVALAALLGGRGAAITAGVCLVLLVGTGVWSDAMATLAATLVATVITLVIGLVLGVWMGRSRRVDQVLRPVLDAGQTMPAFVYLVPFVALFAASRFTAVAAAVVFAAPVAVKIIADGIRGVSPTTIEAATAAGCNRWQVITKVQLPMARQSVTLAANQGLIYVLAMVVVGGLVGAGALGYDVVAGFSQSNLYGKGLASGLAIVLLGIMLDRITQAAARRSGAAVHHS